jgi:hypothetical protein
MGVIMTLTTARVCAGTPPAASLPRRSAAEIGTTKICATLYATEMHTAGLKTSAKRETTSNANDMRKGTMTTTVPTLTNPTVTILPSEDAMKGGSSLSHMT